MIEPDLLSPDALHTPALVLDETRMMRNIARLAARAEGLGVSLRPHLKTAKSLEVGRRVTGGAPGPITVSTLVEAEVFHDAGHADILYAVGIAPQKLARVEALRARGCDLVVRPGQQCGSRRGRASPLSGHCCAMPCRAMVADRLRPAAC